MEPDPVDEKPKEATSQSKEAIVPGDFHKKKEMVEKLVEASKKGGDRKKAKYYQELLKAHSFWDKQPTLRDDKVQEIYGSIEGLRKVQDVRKEPFQLPSEDLVWSDIDVLDDKQLEDLYQLLTNNYVEDEDNTFRFDYSREFLRWALTPPGYQKSWLVGVRDKTGILLASITGVPVLTLVENEKIKMAEINYLCVHKKIRVQKLAPILISQVTRRVNLRDKWQAIYTSGRTLPTPFTQATYWHRSLNPKKLVEIRFSGLGPNQTMAMLQKLYKLPEEITLEGLRPMVKKDVDSLCKLVNNGLSKYAVKFHFTEEEIKHYFIPRENIVYTYVLEKTEIVNEKKKTTITDVLSFYNLPSHVMKNPKHNMLHACYSFYNFATTVPYQELIRNALILAKIHKFDVYNCLDLMENASVFTQLHFQVGDGCLNYYLYNWIMKARHITPKQLGVVLF